MRRKGIIEQMAVAERPAVETVVHYPDCDGEPMAENDMQHRAICYASGALRARFADHPDVNVRGDLFIYYRNGDPNKSIVPDVFVVFGAVEVPLSSYKTWEGGGSHGRLDIAVRAGGRVYLFEFKVVERARAMLARLRARGYVDRHRHIGELVYLVGVEFSEQARNLARFEAKRA